MVSGQASGRTPSPTIVGAAVWRRGGRRASSRRNARRRLTGGGLRWGRPLRRQERAGHLFAAEPQGEVPPQVGEHLPVSLQQIRATERRGRAGRRQALPPAQVGQELPPEEVE